jgi:hypothetical protein
MCDGGGIKLGEKGGEINDQFKARFANGYDYKFKGFDNTGNTVTLANTVSYDRAISPKNPVGIFWTTERDTATSASSGSANVTTNLFGVQGRF